MAQYDIEFIEQLLVNGLYEILEIKQKINGTDKLSKEDIDSILSHINKSDFYLRIALKQFT